MTTEIPLRKSIIFSKQLTQIPACYLIDEVDKGDTHNAPSIDVDGTTLLMENTLKLASSKNSISEEDDWELKINKIGWNPKMHKIFNKVVRILDYDRLARLSCSSNKKQEIMQTKVAIDKSADRMRKLLASFEWDLATIQWINTLLMENLPASYLAAYLDIMQTLKSIVPSLVDKMIFWKPGNVNQELLAAILKKPWQPTLVNKYRKLQGNALIVVIPPLSRTTAQPPRVQRLFTLFTTLSPILPIQLNTTTNLNQQSLQSFAEQTISITRSKIQELKNENPDRRLILIGMHSSSSLALQVSLVEQVSGVICFGFSYNTVHGPRGYPDDHLLKVNCPILFLIGQNSVRASEEELEIIRDKLNQNSTLQQTVTVGGADDFLRISKKKRKFESLTQEMVDNLIVDEIADFAQKCIQRPLMPQVSKHSDLSRHVDSSTGQGRKRKNSLDDSEGPKLTKVSKLKAQSNHAASSNDLTERAVQSIISEISSEAKPYLIQRGEANSKSVKKTNFINLQHNKKLAEGSLQLSQKITSSISRGSAKGKFLPLAQNLQKSNNFSPPKFTIVRSAAATPSTSSVATSSQSYLIEKEVGDTNIYDMPVVFADSDGNVVANQGNLQEGNMGKLVFKSGQHVIKNSNVKITSSSAAAATSNHQKPLVTLTKNKNILIQKPVQNKLLVLNGIVGRHVPAQNVIIPSQAIQTGQMIKVQQKTISHQAIVRDAATGKKIEILDQTIIKPASSGLNPPKNVSFINLADSKTNKISISNTNLRPGQLIVKTSNLKPITLTGTKQFGNITVNKFIASIKPINNKPTADK